MADFSLDDARQALDFIAPDCSRDDWVRLATALKGQYGDAAFSVWDAWSAGGRGYSTREAKAVWKSARVGKAGIGTLIYMAKAEGWKFERPEQTPAQRQAMAARMAELERLRLEQERAEAEHLARVRPVVADACRALWQVAEGEGSSPYLERKQVAACGLGFFTRAALVVVDSRAYEWRLFQGEQVRDGFNLYPKAEHISLRKVAPGDVVVPMLDIESGVIEALQIITAAGKKLFFSDSQKKGLCHVLGDVQGADAVLLAEGYATGASCWMATGLPVLVCFDAGNLEAVAEKARALWPEKRLVVCADDDSEPGKKENTGRLKAQRVAQRFAAVVALPVMPEVLSA